MKSFVGCGTQCIWRTHLFPNEKWLVCAIKRKLSDNFITNWHVQLDNSSSGIIYKLIKTNMG